jgi:hypothetical protein
LGFEQPVDQVGLAETAISIDPQVCGDLVKVGERTGLEGLAVEY